MKYSITDINSSFSFSGIYKWENEINGKVYIGQSINIYNRFLDYKKGRFNPHMKSAINKYGIDNFSIEILEKDIDETNLNAYEQKWIDFYQSYLPENGYNIAPIAGNTRGVKKSKAEREAMSKRASKRTGELNPFYGKHHNDETKKKISESLKGRKSSRAKRVQCIETKEEFDSQAQLAKSLNVYVGAISACINKPNRTCKGKHYINI